MVEEGAEHKKSGRGAKFEEVEACLIRWVKHKLARNLPIPGGLIKAQAMEFAKKLDVVMSATGQIGSYKSFDCVMV